MYPILFQTSGFALASWHVFFVLGAFAAWYALQSIRMDILPGVSASALDRGFVGLYILGYFGARIFSILTEDNISSVEEFFEGLITFGAMTLYGGIIAVALGVLVFCYWKNLSLYRLAAFFTGPGLIAIGIGRIGCFLNGDDYGRAVADNLHPPAYAVRFPNLADGIYRYPVQLWEAAFGLFFGLLCIVFIKRYPRIKPHVADIGVFSYTIGRFVLEFYRGDDRGQFLGTALSTSQGISLVLLALWVIYRVKSRVRPEFQ